MFYTVLAGATNSGILTYIYTNILQYYMYLNIYKIVDCIIYIYYATVGPIPVQKDLAGFVGASVLGPGPKI